MNTDRPLRHVRCRLLRDAPTGRLRALRGVCCVLLLGSVVAAFAQTGQASWRDDLFVMGEGGVLWRRPEVVGTAARIGTGPHTDGFWGLGARLHLRNTMISLGWYRHKRSIYYTISDKGITATKSTLPMLSYTSLPVRIGQRFPIGHRRIHLVPMLALAWSFADEAPGTRTSGSSGTGLTIDGNTGDTVRTSTSAAVELLERNTFTLGPGLEINATFGRWIALAGVEYLWDTSVSLRYAVTYDRTSTLDGPYHEQAMIEQGPTVLALRWAVCFRLTKERVPEAGTW